MAAGATPLAGALVLGQFVYACGVVENAAGWPVEGVQVRAFGTGPYGRADNANHLAADSTLSAVSDANGVVTLRLRDESYVLVASDAIGPSDPSRGGAAYVPTPNSHASGHPVVAGLCTVDGVAVPGIPLGAAGRLTIQAPGQAFLVANVTDGLLETDAALADVDVSLTLTVRDDPEDQLHVHTNESGEARLACPSGASGTTVTLRAHLDQYVDRVVQVPCKASSSATVVPIALWRTPITVVATVTNATDVTDATPAAARDERAGLEVPLADARVAIAAQAGVRPLTGTHLCPDQAADPNALVGASAPAPYVCAATTNAAGVAQLRLPWGAAYDLSASLAPYASQTLPLALDAPDGKIPSPGAEPDDPQDPSLSGMNTRSLRFTLRPPEVRAFGNITDAHGVGIAGVSLEFWDNVTALPATTNATGGFEVPIVAGPYFLNLTKTGYNARQCFVRIGADSMITVLQPAVREHCFTLIAQDKALVTGTIKDKEVGLTLAGVPVCATYDTSVTVCDTSHADGRYHLELPAATSITINTSASARWEFSTGTGFTPAIVRTTGASNTITDLGDAHLARVRVPVTFVARNATDPLDNVDVRVALSTGAIISPLTGNVTDATGSYVLNLRWTTHPSISGLNVPDYTVSMSRHRASGHHGEASQSFGISILDTAITQTLTLAPEANVSTAITVLDAHTRAPVADVTVTASKRSVEADSNMVCDPLGCQRTTSAGGGANLQLPGGHSWKVCAVMTNYDVGTGCLDTVPAGGSATLLLNRTKVSVTVKVLDPHTGFVVANRALLARGVGDFACATSSTLYTCGTSSTKTSMMGTVSLVVPWSNANELCFAADAGTGDVVLQPVLTTGVTEAGVLFQAAQNCAPLAAGSPLTNVPLNALRANASAWTGTVLAANGTPVDSAVVTPTIHRSGFVCKPAPAAHHSGNGAATDCDGKAAPSGAYSLSLPMGTNLLHRWTVTAAADGHFDETWTLAPHGAAMPFRLWPESFVANITIQLGDAKPCGAGGGLQFYLFDLERVRPETLTTDPATSTPASPAASVNGEAQEDGSCRALVPIVAWNRAPQPLPHGAPAWSKERNAYAYEILYNGYVGYGTFQLGPLDAEENITLTRLSTTPNDYAAGIIGGKVTDGDAVSVTGIPATIVTATRAEGPCHGTTATFQAATDANGEYELPVACPGTYSVNVSQPGGLYLEATPQETVIEGDPLQLVGGPEALPRPQVDFALDRTLVTLTVSVTEIDRQTPVAGVMVDATGVQVASDPAAQPTGADGRASLQVPWGAYTIVLTAPQTHVLLTPAFAVAAMPGGPSQLTALALKV